MLLITLFCNVKNIYLTIVLSVICLISQAQVITIAEARTKALGTTVTIRGIVLNGDEIGTSRYIDDGTGGIGVYSLLNSTLHRGDSIEVSGVLGHFNNLLQLSSNVTFTKLDSNKALPQPIVFNGVNAGAFAKAYESRLVMIKGITSLANISGTTCTGAASVFAGNKNYCLNNASATPVRVSNPTNGAGDIIGKNAPSGSIAIVGIMSMFNKGALPGGGTTTDPQYYDTTLSSGFQLLARLYEDFILPAKPNFIEDPKPTWNLKTQLPNIKENEIEVEFTTQNLGTTFLEFGTTPTFGSSLGDSLYVKKHIVTLSGLSPATIYYIRATSSNPNGVSVSKISSVVTKSNSTGSIKVYFNHMPDTSLATFNKAVYLDKQMDDTVFAYMNRATKSIDLAIYNLNPTNLADFIKALNDAHTRGVRVRVVYEGSTANIGLNSLDPAIGIIGRNDVGTIMHNKFMAIDADDENAKNAMVWTGTTNLTKAQIETDQNSIIFIQDQSLARAYTLEFEEMFGSTTNLPNVNKSKFGAKKSNNTPHDFIIGGKYIEQYFSPSDLTTSHIINSFNTANTDQYFMSMSFTRSDISTAIRNRAYAGAYGAGIMNDTTGASANVFNMLAANNVLGTRVYIDNQSGIMHEKTGIIDANNCGSDPLVLSGSHNWSNNAENDNDENIVIIHDADITNQYYQSFSSLYKAVSGKTLKGFVNFIADAYITDKTTSINFADKSTIKPNTWSWDFGDGKTDNGAATTSHKYDAAGTYKVKLIASNGTISDSSVQYVVINDNIGFIKTIDYQNITVYPNPASNYIYIQTTQRNSNNIFIYDMSGRIITSKVMKNNTEAFDISALSKGLYILQVTNTEGASIYNQKIIVQ